MAKALELIGYGLIVAPIFLAVRGIVSGQILEILALALSILGAALVFIAASIKHRR